MTQDWSQEFIFSKEVIKQNAPTSPGIYKILQLPEYQRYEGRTRVLKIGQSGSDLQAELLNHFARHTTANRLARIQKRSGVQVTFKHMILDSEDAQKEEKSFLRQFEDKHWDLPLLNSKRGYVRDEDRHYRVKVVAQSMPQTFYSGLC